MNDRSKLTVSQVAEQFGVTGATVRRWADDGLLPATRTLGGSRRFDPTVVEEKLRDAGK